jgi:hypothetical protein
MDSFNHNLVHLPYDYLYKQDINTAALPLGLFRNFIIVIDLDKYDISNRLAVALQRIHELWWCEFLYL